MNLHQLKSGIIGSIILLFILPHIALPQPVVNTKQSKNRFPVVSSKSVAQIVYDTRDHKVVALSADLFAGDIERVTQKLPDVLSSDNKLKGHIILIGTIGKNQRIDQLIAANKIDVSDIEGQWERFTIQSVEKPFKGVKKALVIAGSDKRGTAFGVFTLSEWMGVSPWYYWADVPVKKKDAIYVDRGVYVSKAPTVKYRGIFLNDEDWGLHPWAAKNIDTELGDIGPNTYAKIFELLLRLKANMVAPAMHECTKAFYTVPGNMKMAADYGIMMTTSHCEPLLYNNASEWDKKTQGEWNYATNKSEIVNVLENRVQQAHKNENIYTIALRGMHDEGMKGGSDEEKLAMLTEAIKDQRGLLQKHIDKPIEDIPQIFVPYKEVLGLYEKGLEVPEEITIVWPDDNYGYIKKLSNKEEQERKGGAGVYYHISYLGWPNDYLWLNTTPPALMYTEMHKAYSLGANKYWLLNVGDIKPGELGMALFLDMAWDMDQFNFYNINDYQVRLLTSIFGYEYHKDFNHILDRFYYHGFTRKPEYMTWDWRWNSLFQVENVKDTEFSFIHYNEAENRLNDYKHIAELAKSIMDQLPETQKAAFFELVYYPVKGASLYNHEMLLGQKNRWYAAQGRARSNQLAKDVKLYHDSLAMLTAEYNQLLNGKWDGMMTAPGFLPKIQISPTQTITLKERPEMGIFVKGMAHDTLQHAMLPAFNKAFDEPHFFDIYNKGKGSIKWTATASEPWIELSESTGTTAVQTRINVRVNWDKLDQSDAQQGEIWLDDGQTRRHIRVSAIISDQAQNKDLYVPYNGAIAIKPTQYHNKIEIGGIEFTAIDKLGYSNAALQLGNARYDDGLQSFVSYDFYVDEPGEIEVQTYMLPLFAKDKAHSTRYGLKVDDSDIIIHHNDVKEYSRAWAGNVIRNSAINKTSFTLDKAGKHSLKIYCVDPGMIVQKIVIDCGGLKESYLGPAIP